MLTIKKLLPAPVVVIVMSPESGNDTLTGTFGLEKPHGFPQAAVEPAAAALPGDTALLSVVMPVAPLGGTTVPLMEHARSPAITLP